MPEKEGQAFSAFGRPLPTTPPEQQAWAVDFFNFIGHPDLAEAEMEFIKKDEQGVEVEKILFKGGEFYKFCGPTVDRMVQHVISLSDDDPNKARYMSALEATAFSYAGLRRSTDQPSPHEPR